MQNAYPSACPVVDPDKFSAIRICCSRYLTYRSSSQRHTASYEEGGNAPMANTFLVDTPLTLKVLSTSMLPSASNGILLLFKKVVAGLTPTAIMTISAGKTVPSESWTPPISFGDLIDGTKEVTVVDRRNTTPFCSCARWSASPTRFPSI